MPGPVFFLLCVENTPPPYSLIEHSVVVDMRRYNVTCLVRSWDNLCVCCGRVGVCAFTFVCLRVSV